MNSKAIAVIMAVAMAVIGFSVAITDDADAVPTERDLGRQVITNGESVSLVVGINEGNYTGYKYKVTWTLEITTTGITDGNGKTIFVRDASSTDAKDDSTNRYVNETGFITSSGSEKYSISMTRDDTNIGEYTITITAGNEATTKDLEFRLTPEIQVYTDGGDKTFTNFAQYKFSVAVIKPNTSMSLVLNNADAKVGMYYNKKIAFDISDSSGMMVEDYDWYAVGLPKGLTMASNGQVSGIPTSDGTTETIYVFATDKTGNMYYGKISNFTVAAKQTAVEANGFGYYINDNNVDNQNKANYVFQANETITLYVTNSTMQNVINENVTVTVINETDLGTSVSTSMSNQDSYALPDGNSGAYTVTITVGDAEPKTTYFTVYILGDAADITASIVIEGA